MQPELSKPVRDQSKRIAYRELIPFLLMHVACLAALFTGITWQAVALCAGLYWLRIVGIGAGYHRYFSHKAFKTGRVRQFLLAFLAQTSMQRGALWWASKHRAHHRYSDTWPDSHSPVQHGFWFSHIGWIFAPEWQEADYDNIKDLTRYPELVWLDRHRYMPGLVLAFAAWLLAGWPGLVVGFLWSTVLVYHATFSINSVAHVSGRQRYVTGDDSRNNWWLALITSGEGWHNNHHYFPASARQGFHWWEVDCTYYLLRMGSVLGLVRDLRAPPEHVVRGERHIPRTVVERVSARLAEHFSVDAVLEQMRESWPSGLQLEELRRRGHQARVDAETFLAEFEIPALPSLEDIRSHAARTFSLTPSIDPIVERTRRIILGKVSARLMETDPRPVGA